MDRHDRKSTVSELIVVARALQNRPRISAMEETAFREEIVHLLGEVQQIFKGIRDGDYLLAQAESYAQSEHFELSLAAIQGLLLTHGDIT